MNRTATFCLAGFLLAALFCCGCANTSKIGSAGLDRSVSKAKIHAGMSEDEVRATFGEPSQVLHSGSGASAATTWFYQETVYRERTVWRYRTVSSGFLGPTFLERYPETEFEKSSFMHLQIIFINGAVTTWQTLPRPMY